MTVEHRINFVGSNGDEAVELHRCTVMAGTFEDAVNQALADAVEKGIDCSTLRAIGVEIVLPMSQEQRDLMALARAAYLQRPQRVGKSGAGDVFKGLPRG